MRSGSGQLLYVNETKLALSVVLIPIIEMQIETSSPDQWQVAELWECCRLCIGEYKLELDRNM